MTSEGYFANVIKVFVVYVHVALGVHSMDPCGCKKGIKIVPKGYKIYIRYGYSLY